MERLPLFPLPLVLFPGASTPLHIFEARYRRMVARCIEYDGRFGLLYHDSERLGSFEVEPDRMGTIAEIRDFQILPDGRSLFMAHGGARFRIEDGIESDTPYHEALLEPVEDEPPPDAGALVARRQSSVALFNSIVNRLRHAEDGSILPDLDPTEEVSFRIAEHIPIDAGWQQAFLELRLESSRLDRLDALLMEVLLGMKEAEGEPEWG